MAVRSLLRCSSFSPSPIFFPFVTNIYHRGSLDTPRPLPLAPLSLSDLQQWRSPVRWLRPTSSRRRFPCRGGRRPKPGGPLLQI
ncbi:hypothetical protein ZWY2020_029252 [Hordeum vulgare]|nr:hypothetical protein ZWY2020_029252 [Hordeum vulgare]